MDVKPGYLTTEFWASIISSVLVLLVTTGVIGDVEAETFGELATGLVAAVLPIVGYGISRAVTKKRS